MADHNQTVITTKDGKVVDKQPDRIGNHESSVLEQQTGYDDPNTHNTDHKEDYDG